MLIRRAKPATDWEMLLRNWEIQTQQSQYVQDTHSGDALILPLCSQYHKQFLERCKFHNDKTGVCKAYEALARSHER